MIDVYIIMLIRSVNYLYDLTEIYTQSVILHNFQNELVNYNLIVTQLTKVFFFLKHDCFPKRVKTLKIVPVYNYNKDTWKYVKS